MPGARIAETFLEGEGDLQTAAFQRLYVCMMQPAFLTTSFMHCRNVCVKRSYASFQTCQGELQASRCSTCQIPHNQY